MSFNRKFVPAVVQIESKVEYLCGSGYIKMGETETGLLASPFYPSGYPNMMNCIWLLEAPSKRKAQFTLNDLDGEEKGGLCLDFLEIRRGNKSANILFSGCKISEPVTIKSETRWLWIKFLSNGANAVGKGFTGVYSSFPTADRDEQTPVIRCPSTKYKCNNQECIVNAYLCDGSNDCGCTEESCDENNCEREELSTTVLLGVGIGLGSVVFIGIFIGVGLLDIYLKYRTERMNKMLEEKAKKRSRRRATKKGSGLLTASLAAGRSSNGSVASLKSLGESQRSDRLRKLSVANEIVSLPKEKTFLNAFVQPAKA